MTQWVSGTVIPMNAPVGGKFLGRGCACEVSILSEEGRREREHLLLPLRAGIRIGSK